MTFLVWKKRAASQRGAQHATAAPAIAAKIARMPAASPATVQPESPSLKILHVMWWLEFGGIERLVLDLCREQRRQGLSPSVLVGSGHGRMAAEFAAAQVPVHVAGLASGSDIRPGRVREVRRLMGAADVVHCHVYSPAFALAARGIPTPIVFTDHGNAALGRPKTWRDRLIRRLQGHFLNRQVAFTTFISEHTRRMAARDFRLPAASAVVHNGIDLAARAAPAAIPVDQLPADLGEAFVVGTSCRFAGFKRIDRLIRGFAGLGTLDHCYLLLVGDGPLRPEYEALATELGIRERTLFTGYQADVRGLQQAMDVCVFPSAAEPFGLVAVETLALGKPTIVMADGGGITEIIATVSPDDVVAGEAGLTARLAAYREAWRQGGELLSVALASRRREHAARFDIRRMAAEMLAIYRDAWRAEGVAHG